MLRLEVKEKLKKKEKDEQIGWRKRVN